MRRARRADDAGGEVGAAVKEVDQLQRGQAHGHGIDREITSDEIVGQARPEGHLGLAGVGIVGLGPIGRDLHLASADPGAHRAEPDADVPGGLGHRGDEGQHRVRVGIGGEVEVDARRIRETSEEGVAHRPTDQCELVPGLREDPAEGGQDPRRRHQLGPGRLVQGQAGSGGGTHGTRA